MQMEAMGAYLAYSDSQIVFQLPTDSMFGDSFLIVGLGAGGWTIQQNDGQTIFYNGSQTTVGSSGSLSSTNFTDVVEFFCSTNDGNTYSITSSEGTLTIV